MFTTRHIRIGLLLLCLNACGIAISPSRAEAADISGEWLNRLHMQLDELGLSSDSTNLTRAVVLSFVREIDPKAEAITQEEWVQLQNERAGMFYSPGLSLEMTNGLPRIQSIVSNAPLASRADAGTGDVIVGIGTQVFNKVSLPAAQHLLKSDSGLPVTLRVLHGGTTNTIEAERVLLQEAAIERVELLSNNMGYIKINGLYMNSGRDVVSRIRAWSETERDGIILDLRGAGGDDVTAVAQIASLFVPTGQFLFAYRDRHQQDLDVVKALQGSEVSIPLMVLIDRRTTGAAEVLAAVLNSSARQSLMIGETTAGDFTLRDAVNIAGHLLLVATKVLDTADGIRYNGKFGVDPAVLVDGRFLDTHDYEPPDDLLDRREKLEEEERDLQTRRRTRGDGALERALDILIGLKSLNKADSRLSSPNSFQELTRDGGRHEIPGANPAY